ncbi:MAG: hypothetical protein ACD_58C00123G0005 [uncultured bacterium]|nr:MAG: hypothetical protein ACD_58C00123G0005 [uncultured bacterium]
MVNSNNEIAKFEKKNHLSFNDKDLFRQVFVHRSYLNENPGFNLDHNERLEFLGDAVLELVVTEYLYKNYPNPEGELTNWRSALVKGERLSQVATKLNIEKLLYLSRGEQKSSGKSRQLILANAFEALIGAIYLDKGYQKVQKYIYDNIIIYLEEILDKKLFRDAKSTLQEISQEKFSITPNYNVLEESGPDHNKHFIVGVFIGDKQVGRGNGYSKQTAEQDAAKNSLETNNF